MIWLLLIAALTDTKEAAEQRAAWFLRLGQHMTPALIIVTLWMGVHYLITGDFQIVRPR